MSLFNIIITGLALIVCLTAAYGIGMRRGWLISNEEHEHDYDNGYIAGYDDSTFDHEEHEQIAYKLREAKDIVKQLGELFEDKESDENNIIDCGSY